MVDPLISLTSTEAISNHRLLSCQNGQVTFNARDNSNPQKPRRVTLPASSLFAVSSSMCSPQVLSKSDTMASWPPAMPKPNSKKLVSSSYRWISHGWKSANGGQTKGRMGNRSPNLAGTSLSSHGSGPQNVSPVQNWNPRPQTPRFLLHNRNPPGFLMNRPCALKNQPLKNLFQ